MSSPSPHEDLSTEELFRRFAPFVARFLYRLGVGSEGLDDLVQEVFLVVHRRGGYKSGPAKPTSYLATNRRLCCLRASSKAAHGASAGVGRGGRGTDVDSKGPVQLLEVSERLELLQSALERLDPDLRATLVLADSEGESCASIAASSGVPAGPCTGGCTKRGSDCSARYERRWPASRRTERAPRATRQPSDAGGARRWPSRSTRCGCSPTRDRLLKAATAQPPVDYDVGAGLARHRELASAPAAMPSQPPGVAELGSRRPRLRRRGPRRARCRGRRGDRRPRGGVLAAFFAAAAAAARRARRRDP